jgi:putative oxidoreductase
MDKYLAFAAQIPAWASHLFLLLVRSYWGWAFLQNGWGKLQRIDEIAKWFGEDLHIPMPYLNAWMASGTELIGGALLLVGLGTRYAGAALAFTMTIAFLTSDFGGLESLWLSAAACEASPTCVPFEEAAPFSYLMASVIGALWGGGLVSLDGVLRAVGLGRWVLERP